MCNTLPSKKSHSVQGIAMPAFIANTSAEPIAMFEMPAFCNRDFRSSSLSVSTSFSIRTDDSSPLMASYDLHLCTPDFHVLEQAAVVCARLLLGA